MIKTEDFKLLYETLKNIAEFSGSNIEDSLEDFRKRIAQLEKLDEELKQ